MPHFAADERIAFAQTLRQTDPTAPTLCGEWNAAQLAAHAVLRETTLLEPAGRFLPGPLEGRADAALNRLAATPWPELVDRLEAGPTRRSTTGWLWALPPVREAANLLEYVIHHEDVRRAAAEWQPRELPDQVQAALWKRVGLMARLTLRKSPVAVTLEAPGIGTVSTRRSAPSVVASGTPVELALFVSGRVAHARLDWDGPAADIDAVRGTDLSF